MKKKPEIFTEDEYECHKAGKELAKITSKFNKGSISILEAVDELDELERKINKLESKKAK